MKTKKQIKYVYVIQETSEGKSRWTQVGVCFENKDGSLNVILDALPLNGRIQIRDKSI